MKKQQRVSSFRDVSQFRPDFQRLRRVREAEGASFAELVAVAELDPKTDFRFLDLRGVNFGETDMSGFDFSGADLREANMSRVQGLERANMTNALLKGIRRPRSAGISIDVAWPGTVSRQRRAASSAQAGAAEEAVAAYRAALEEPSGPPARLGSDTEQPG